MDPHLIIMPEQVVDSIQSRCRKQRVPEMSSPVH
jgi:hypothetical protein